MALGRLSQRITENFKESTRDLPILQLKNPNANQSYFEYSDERHKEISTLLEGGSTGGGGGGTSRAGEGERLEGMKRIIAMMSKGRDMSAFFPQVVKQVASPSIEIRKLVYIYLLRYADTNADLLLLSINTFQKDLSDASPLIRSMAIRVLTGIRLSVVQGIVMAGLKRLVNDRNPWVRKTVALALIKVYDSDSATLPQLIPLLTSLLNNASPITLGATLTAYTALIPDNLAILHPHFRKICRILIDADEWGQVVVLDALCQYARGCLEKPEWDGSVKVEEAKAARAARVEQRKAAKGKGKGEGKADGDAVDDDQEERDDADSGEAADEEDDDNDDEDEDPLDPDIELLLHCTLPLFQSQNAAVILSAVRLFYYIGPADSPDIGQETLVAPLLRVCDNPLVHEEYAWTGWETAKVVARERPWLFQGKETRFLLRNSDSTRVKRNKIQILALLVNPGNADFLVKEFREYVKFTEDGVSDDAIKAIGYVARKIDSIRQVGLATLMKLLRSRRESSVGQAVVVLKSLIQTSTDHDTASRLVARLTQQLASITNANARACVFWLASRYAATEEEQSKLPEFEGLALWAPDVLRIGVKGFTQEAPIVKIQILGLAAILLTLCPASKQIGLLNQYVFSLARYDEDWDVRDRGRFLNALLKGVRQGKNGMAQETGSDEEDEDVGGVVLRREQVKVVLLGELKPSVISDQDLFGPPQQYNVLATLSSIGGKELRGYKYVVPSWCEEPTDPSLREVEEEKPAAPPPPTFLDSRAPSFQVPPRPGSALSGTNISTRAGTPVLSGSPANAGPAKKKFKDLDDFLNESSESEEETESEEEDLPPPKQLAKPGVHAAATDDEESESEDESTEDESDEDAALVSRNRS